MSGKPVRIIGVPMDLGAGRRGVDMGPSAIRIGRLSARLAGIGRLVEDSGNIGVEVPEQLRRGRKKELFLKEISAACTRLAEGVEQALDEERLPLVLGGDHSIAAGSVSGVAAHHRRAGNSIGLIWLDAHTDMNVPKTSPSGNVHGMPLAALLGLGPRVLAGIGGFHPKVAVEHAVVIGARSIDPAERKTVLGLGLRVITMTEIDKRGMPAVMEEAIEIAGGGTSGFHCSFDLDVVDPDMAPGVGTPSPGGITYRESHLAMELIAESGALLALELVEVNPVLDTRNRTGDLAVDLACSALGQRIL